MEKIFYKDAEITQVKPNKFYVIGFWNKKEIVDYISKQFNITNFMCFWIEVEEIKAS